MPIQSYRGKTFGRVDLTPPWYKRVTVAHYWKVRHIGQIKREAPTQKISITEKQVAV